MSEPLSPTVWLAFSARQLMEREATKWHPREAGGVLIGYVSGVDVVITNATGPGSSALHGRFSYVPDHDFDNREVARLYRESGRMHTYLGDWHSHPNGGSYLSFKDSCTLRRIARFPAARMDRPLMLVLGGNQTKWSLGCFRVASDRKFKVWTRITPIDVMQY